MQNCLNCGAPTKVLIKHAKDYEYGVEWDSDFVSCSHCGLVAQEPRVLAEEIPKLYPSNYYVHSSASKKKGIYGFLKHKLDSKKIKKISNFLPQNGVVVEVGCGNGAFLLTLEQARPDLTLIGIDIVDPGVFENSNVQFFVGQLDACDIPAESVDLIFFDDLLEHVENPMTFLDSCNNLLKKGGVVFGITPDHASLDRKIFKHFWAGYHYPRHTFLFDHNNIKEILSKTNFQNINVKGSNGLWVKTLKNIFIKLPATKKRGLLHYGAMIAFYPIDLIINLFVCHGEMSFIAHKK